MAFAKCGGFTGLAGVLLVTPAVAQQSPAANAAPPAAAVQITAAVFPLPDQFRADATVLGYEAGKPGLMTLREGTGPHICLADYPGDANFHAACYHRSLEPFMARGRELRTQGHDADVDTVRFAEIKAGKLAMPDYPAALYSVTGPATGFDQTTGAVTGARPLYVVYIPYATAASTGLPTIPAQGQPWLMFPGTPKAHIMMVGEMR